MTCLATVLAGAMVLVFGGSAHAADLPYRGEDMLMLNPGEVEWSDVAFVVPPAQIAAIEGDLAEREPFTFRLKLPAGYQISPHTHPAYERVTVISGTLHFAHGDTFNRDDTTVPVARRCGHHAAQCADVRLCRGGHRYPSAWRRPWGIEYINPQDDPRS